MLDGEHRADQHLDDFHRDEGAQEYRGQRVQRAAARRAPQGCGAACHGGKHHHAGIDGQRAHDGSGAPVQHPHGGRRAAFGRRFGSVALFGDPAVDASVDVHGDHPQQDEGEDGGGRGQGERLQGMARGVAVHAQAAARGQCAHVFHALAHVGRKSGQEALDVVGHAFLQPGFGGLRGRRGRACGTGSGRLCAGGLRAQLIHQRLARFGILQQVRQGRRSQRRGRRRRGLRL